MQSAALSIPQGLADLADRISNWPKPALIAAMVIGFVAFWPLGFVFLYLLIRRKPMACMRRSDWSGFGAFRPTGNAAFDDYRRATLERLDEESREFKAFVDRLRKAKDQAEFEAFMAERSRQSGASV